MLTSRECRTDLAAVDGVWNLIVEVPCPILDTISKLVLCCETCHKSPKLTMRAIVAIHNVATWEEGAGLVIKWFPRAIDALLISWERSPESKMSLPLRNVIAQTAHALEEAAKRRGVEPPKAMHELIRVTREIKAEP